MGLYGRLMLIVLLSFYAVGLRAQLFSISGRIVDRSTDQPLAGAEVYLNHTSIRTSTDAKGSFRLDRVPSGTYELILSSLGYGTEKYPVSPTTETGVYYLTPRALEIDSIVLSPSRHRKPEKWRKWEKYFTEQVLGSSSYASSCRISNPEDLALYYDRRAKVLSGSTPSRPLEIVNSKLGYILHCEVEDYEWDRSESRMHSQGNIRFEEMQGDSTEMGYWADNREKVYNASLLRFMRSFYTNTLEQDGYTLYSVVGLERADSIKMNQNNFLVDIKLGHAGEILKARISGDLAIDSLRKVTGGRVLLETEGAFAIASENQLVARDLLLDYITATPMGFMTYHEGYSFPEDFFKVVSKRLVSLMGHREAAVEIYPNGNYQDKSRVTISGFFEWAGKLGMALPLDYRPEGD